MDMLGLSTETIVIVGGAFVFCTILLILWGLYFRSEA